MPENQGSPKTRLMQVLDQYQDQLPAMARVALMTLLPPWLDQLTDESVLQFCATTREVINFVEGGEGSCEKPDNQT